MKPFEYEIISGIPYRDIKEYFSDHAEVITDKVYSFKECSVSLETLKPKINKAFCLSSTRIFLSGNKKACELIISDYRKAFLRGGA